MGEPDPRDAPSPDAAASADDRAWFAAHPGETQRWRRAFDGEFDPPPPGFVLAPPPAPAGFPGPTLHVLVTKVAPNLRLRLPYWLLDAPDVLPLLPVSSGWTLAQLAPAWGHA